MNFQDVIRNVYDSSTNTLGVRLGGVGNSIVTIANTVPVTFSGNVTLSDSKTYVGLTSTTLGAGDRYIGLTTTTLGVGDRYIGLVTVTQASSARTITGNLTLSDSKGYIGLVTVTQASSARSITGNLTLSDSKTGIGLVSVFGGSLGIIGNLTISDSKGFIGLTTAVNSQSWPDPKTYIGLVTATLAGSVNTGMTTIFPGPNYIGLVTNVNGLAWPDPKTFIGLVTADLDHAWPDPKTYIGLATSTLGVGTQFVGLVTAWTRNAGSAKTLTPYALTLSTSSVVTIAVPTNAQSMYISNGVLSSDATVRVSIKSGVTYMTGNASLGITLNPGGGFIMPGGPDTPFWIGLPSGALVIEKFDMTATKANIGGTLVTFTE